MNAMSTAARMGRVMAAIALNEIRFVALKAFNDRSMATSRKADAPDQTKRPAVSCSSRGRLDLKITEASRIKPADPSPLRRARVQSRSPADNDPSSAFSFMSTV